MPDRSQVAWTGRTARWRQASVSLLLLRSRIRKKEWTENQDYRLARTRSPNFDSIQEMILERTAALFASRGYAATSIGDIAKACECSKSRLYHYFPAKELILSHMLLSHVSELAEAYSVIERSFADPTVRLQELMKHSLNVYTRSRDKHVVLLTCIEFLSEDVRDEVLSRQREMVSTVRRVFASLRPDIAEKGGLSHMDAMLFFGMVNWTYTWYRVGGSVDHEELALRAVDIFLSGYENFQN